MQDVRGINDGDIKKLIDAGIYSVEQLAQTPLRHICKIKGISEAKANILLKEMTRMSSVGFTTAGKVLNDRQHIVYLTTGSKELDKLLGGGIETGTIVEVYGEFRVGKTQLCHTLAVTCQLPIEMGGAAARSMYIDTEGTFRPETLVAIAERFNLTPEYVLDQVAVTTATTLDHLIVLLKRAGALMMENRYGLLIINSLMGPLRAEFNGRGELQERQLKLMQFLSVLKKIACIHKVAVVITNQVVSQVDNFFGDPKKAIGGHIMSHNTTTRICLEKRADSMRQAKLTASPLLPEGSVVCSITTGGVQDSVNE